MEKVSMLGHRDNRKRVGSTVGADGRSFQRIQSYIHPRSSAADLFTDVEHRRLVSLAFADNDGSIDGEGVEGAAHCIHGRLIRGPFVASTGEPGTTQCCRLSNANSLQG